MVRMEEFPITCCGMSDSRVLSGKTSSSRVHDDDYMIWYGLDTDKSIGCEDAEKERSDDEYLFSPKGAASKHEESCCPQ